MPLFEFEGITQDGSQSKGTLDAGSIGIASIALKKRGLKVVRIAEAPDLPIKLPFQTKTIESGYNEASAVALASRVPMVPATHSSLPEGSSARSAPPVLLPLKASLTEQLFFFTRMRVLLLAGVPLIIALESLERQSQGADLRKAVHLMREHADQGKPIGDAFAAFPRLFSPIAIHVVKAGEAGGFLPEAIRHISQYLDDELELRRLYRQLTFTPKAYTVAALILSLSMFLALWRFFWAPIIAVWITLTLLRRDPKFNKFWDRTVLNIPIIGAISRDFAEAKFGRAFGLLFENGVNVATAVELAADACGNQTFGDALRPAGGRLREGVSVHEALRETQVLSLRFLDMINTGVQTGDIKKMLFCISETVSGDAKNNSVQVAWYVCGFIFLWFCLVWAGHLLVGTGPKSNFEQRIIEASKKDAGQ